MIDDFCCRCPYCIHSLYPKHLIFGFECFGNGIFLSKLLYQPKEHILRLLVQLGEVTVELSTENQTVVQPLAILTDIPKMPQPPYANGPLFFLWDRQAGNVIIALQLVLKTIVFIMNALVHIQNPPYN